MATKKIILNELRSLVKQIIKEEMEKPKENTFNVEDFYKWWGNKYKLSSDFLKRLNMNWMVLVM
jgi:hypothetical protein